MSRILLGETNEDIASAMKEFLLLQNYTVQVEDDGFRVLDCLRQDQYDIMVLEIALNGLDGISVALEYRADGGGAPIVLTASRHSSDELQWGLDAGADAYLVKPIPLADLAARLSALLRRPALRSERMLTSGLLAMDSETKTVTIENVLIHLHPMEFKLLEFLLSHPNQVFNKQALFKQVWEKELGLSDDTVRTHVRGLRRKIDAAGEKSIITTVRGRGYKTENYAVADGASWGFRLSDS